MYARVAKWEGGSAEAIRESIAQIEENSKSGPPEGVPSTGFTFLADAEGGKVIAIALFKTEEDLRTGSATLDSMEPPTSMGTRVSVETYEVAADIRL
ncbi:MAG TPA: hypothetical protein VGO48_12195 [Conexibacter sp.]|jgi:hypothetical protein|nr:hypothetical protein [Conexibacter sp.]